MAYQWLQKEPRTSPGETNTNVNTGNIVEFSVLYAKAASAVAFDYFYRKTTDMLFTLSTPPSVGYTSYCLNMGDMRNSS